MAKSVPQKPVQAAVRSRRAYFDCRFGQLHVRTAFPITGGFDEQVTVMCLHARSASSRVFQTLLSDLAKERSVYAPDLPGFGESDPSPAGTVAESGEAVLDLCKDLRLRQIDILGMEYGASVALNIAAANLGLVRRLVLVGLDATDSRAQLEPKILLMPDGSITAASENLVSQVRGFLDARSSVR